MLKHLFKLIWNKKKENFLLISEVLISFMVMFAVLTLLVYYYQNYKRPRGFEHENVWSVDLGIRSINQKKDSVGLMFDNLKNALRSMPGIKAVSIVTPNVPFSHSMYRTGMDYKKMVLNTNIYTVEEAYKDVLNVKVLEGRWFTPEDDASTYKPIVINETAKEALVGKGNVVGLIVENNQIKKKVIGVIADMKDDSDFKVPYLGMYVKVDTSNINQMGTLLIRVAPGSDATFEGKLSKLISNTVKDSNLEIGHLDAMRIDKNKATIVPMIIFMVVSGFLIFNVALGLFGVLWYNINKRKGEIGLRRAIGASAVSVSRQLVTEAMVLATFSLIIGSVFAIQFPLLHVFDLPASVYLIALLLSIGFIYLLVLVCALYPGKQAAAIYPAIALHED